MKWVFLVSWCLILTGNEVHQVTDDYGRHLYSYYDSYTYEKCDHYKIFFEKDSALDFISAGSKYKDIINLRLDSFYCVHSDTLLIINNPQGGGTE